MLGDVGRALDVVRRAARHVIHEQLFGHAAAHQHGHLRFEVVLRVGVAIGLGQLHRHAHRAPARDDRDLVKRIRLRQQRRDDGVARFVVRAVDAIELAQRHRAPLDAHEHLVSRFLQVVVGDDGPAGAAGKQRRFVDQVREIRPREAGRAARDRSQVHGRIHLNLARVDARGSPRGP